MPTDATAVFERYPAWRVRGMSAEWSSTFGVDDPPADAIVSVETLFGTSATAEAVIRLVDLAALTRSARQATIPLDDRRVHLIATPVRDALGEVRQVLAAVRRLADADARAPIDARPDLVAWFDRDLRVVAVSDAVLEVSGLPREQIVGRTNDEMGYPPRLSQLWDGLYREVFSSGRPATMTYDLPGVDGLRRSMTQILPILGVDGEVVVVAAMSVDITGERRVHPTYDRLEAQVAAAPASVGQARREIMDHLDAGFAWQVADAVEIAVSELVTNAVRHGSNGPVGISAQRCATRYSLAVHQAACGTHIAEPHRWTMPSERSPSGRGLAIVKALTSAVELVADSHHTEVRCTFSIV
jgi:PAS domain-containing protein/anti-sigma regulatory factor (Ser/Thr protein kinase)